MPDSPNRPTVSGETSCKSGVQWRRRESNPRTRPTVSPLVFVNKGYAARRVLERAIYERDGTWDCFYCGRHANSIDHVTARFRGGSESIENLVFACWACNAEKTTTPGWLFALRKCWEFEWPDPFVQPTIHWDFGDFGVRVREWMEERRRTGEAVPSTRGMEPSVGS